MRPWPLLLVAASSDARCGCDRRVIVATTVNGVRTASLLVPSAARVGAALVVYHEDSADAAAGLEPTEPRARRDAPACFVEAAGCYAAHDLHVLYPWLAAFADAQDPTEGPATVFGRAYANAVARRGAPRHATHLTAKAHFIFRKVAAIRHAAEAGARDASVDVVAWADADIELVAPLADARFLAFARAHDVATIHRYVVPSRADYPRDGDAAACLAPRDFFAANRSQRALPDTGFLTLALRGGAAAPALAFARAWSGYYATSFAARSRCLNDICVYDRVLFPTAGTAGDGLAGRARRRGGRALVEARRRRRPGAPAAAAPPPPPPSDALAEAAAAALLPPTAAAPPPGGARAALDRSVAAFARAGRRAVVEGWYALCAEAWPAARAPPPAGAAAARAAGARGDAAGQRLSREAIAARYRVDLGRAHPCPGATPRTSPFHLFAYALHAKGGADKRDWRAADGRRRLEAARRLASDATRRWRAFRKEALSHPFDAGRVNLTSLLGAARGLDLPLGAVVEAARAAAGPTFYDLLATFDAPVGYAVAALDGGARSTLDAADRPRPGARVCAWDAEALGLQASLLVGGACGCATATRAVMEGKIGLGGELSALLKPFRAAVDARARFRTPAIRRVGCAADGDAAACLGLEPLDRCGAGAGAGGFSARLAGKRLAAAPAAAHAHRGLFWWTSQAVAFLARPDGATLGRLWAAQDRLDWAARRPVLGVHVRRGDTCLDGGRGELRKHKGRTCDGLAAYAARARAMVDAHGFRAVFLATDDPQIVAEAQRTNAFGVPVLATGGVENASFSSPCVAARSRPNSTPTLFSRGDGHARRWPTRTSTATSSTAAATTTRSSRTCPKPTREPTRARCSTTSSSSRRATASSASSRPTSTASPSRCRTRGAAATASRRSSPSTPRGAPISGAGRGSPSTGTLCAEPFFVLE